MVVMTHVWYPLQACRRFLNLKHQVHYPFEENIIIGKE
jgi:hypothetical protein